MTGNLSFDLGGQTAIVTGAARGIGREFGRFIQQAKADVCLVDCEGEEVEKAAAVIGAHAWTIAFTKAAKKLARFGVTVNAIHRMQRPE